MYCCVGPWWNSTSPLAMSWNKTIPLMSLSPTRPKSRSAPFLFAARTSTCGSGTRRPRWSPPCPSSRAMRPSVSSSKRARSQKGNRVRHSVSYVWETRKCLIRQATYLRFFANPGSKVAVGQRVAVENHFYCEDCVLCDEGRGDICMNMSQYGHGKGTTQGGCSQLSNISSKYLYPINSNITDEQACLIEPMGPFVFFFAFYC